MLEVSGFEFWLLDTDLWILYILHILLYVFLFTPACTYITPSTRYACAHFSPVLSPRVFVFPDRGACLVALSSVFLTSILAALLTGCAPIFPHSSAVPHSLLQTSAAPPSGLWQLHLTHLLPPRLLLTGGCLRQQLRGINHPNPGVRQLP